MNDENLPEPKPSSWFGAIGSFLWKAALVVAAIAAIVTGAVLLSDTVSNWVDGVTGGTSEKKGWATIVRDTFKPAKDAVVNTFSSAKDKLGDMAHNLRSDTSQDNSPEAIRKRKLIGIAAGEGLLVGVGAWASKPAVAEAAKDAVALGASNLPGAPGAVKDAVRVVADKMTAPFVAVHDVLRPAAAEARAAKVAAQAAEVAAKGAQAAPSAAKILGNLTSKTAPIWKKLGGKAAGPIGAAVTVYADYGHTSDLFKEGKDVSGTMQIMGTGAEAVGGFGSLPGLFVGGAVKDTLSLANTLATGKKNVSNSLLGDVLAAGDGFAEERAGVSIGLASEKVGDGYNWLMGRSEGQIAANAAKMKEIADKNVVDRLSVLTEDDRERFFQIKENAKYHNKDISNTEALLALVKERYPQGVGHLMPNGYVSAVGEVVDPKHGLSNETLAKKKEEKESSHGLSWRGID